MKKQSTKEERDVASYRSGGCLLFRIHKEKKKTKTTLNTKTKQSNKNHLRN